jgi:hypothetical protein
MPELGLEPEPPKPLAFVIAPGVELPAGEGVYVYDGRTVLALIQNHAAVQNDRKRAILGAVAPLPVVKGRAWVLLEGATAKVIVPAAAPVFYLQLSKASPNGYGLVRLKQKEDTRIVGQIAITPITRNTSESQEAIPATVETLKPAASGDEPSILRLSPQKPLAVGEYAVVEYLEEKKLNLFVWDFRVTPSPPAASKPPVR